jgi:hypothetical protein
MMENGKEGVRRRKVCPMLNEEKRICSFGIESTAS